MKLQLAVLAQSVAIDRFTNRLSLFNVIEHIEAPNFPLLVAEAAFVVLLRRENNEVSKFDTTVTMRIGGTAVGKADLHVDFEGGLNTRLVTNFQGLPILNPGDLEFQLLLPGGESVGAIVPVVKTGPPSPSPQVADR